MISPLNCLFCHKIVDIDKVSSKKKDKKLVQVLTELFTTLCNLLQLKFTNPENIWDFKETHFPFCKFCRNDIARLFKLRKEIREIEKNIQQILIKFSTLTLESDVRERAGGVPNPGGKTSKVYENNHEDFRQQIINRYSPNILLEQCESEHNVAGGFVVNETDCEHHEDDSLFYGEEDEILTMKEEGTIIDAYEPFISPDSHTSVKSLRIRNWSPEKPLKKINRLESTSKSNRIPRFQVTVIEGKTFAYRNSRFTIEDKKITCLECGFKTHRYRGERAYLYIKNHINRWHIVKSGCSPNIKLKQSKSDSNVLAPFAVCETDCEQLSDHSPVYENEDEAVRIREEETSAECEPSRPNLHISVNSPRIKNTLREKLLKKINKLESPLPFHFQVTLLEGKTFSFGNSRFTIEGEKITCLECGFITHRYRSPDVYVYIRNHMKRWHIGNTGCSTSIVRELRESDSNVAEPFALFESDREQLGNDSPVYENEDEAVRIREEETSAECEPSSRVTRSCVKSQHQTTTSLPEKPLKKINKFESTSKNRQFQARAVLIEGKTFSYHSSRFTVEDEEITCLECGFKTHRYRGEGDIVYKNIKFHIHRWHIGKSGKTLVPTATGKPLPPVLVDKATKTYNLKGFRFRATDEGHLCLTCGFLARFPPLRKNKRTFVNIKSHIRRHHMGSSPNIKLKQSESDSNVAGPFAVCETDCEQLGVDDPVYENEGAVRIREVETSAECKPSNPNSHTAKSLHKTNSSPEKPLTNKLEIISETRRYNFEVTLIEGKTFSYRKSRFTIEDEKITCLECGFKTHRYRGERVYLYIKNHINRWHIGKSGKAFVKPIEAVELVDKETKTYSVKGFRFRTTNEGHLCLTCGFLSRLPQTAKRKNFSVNIRRHIEVTHMAKEKPKNECKICRDGILRRNLTAHNAVKHAKESTSLICDVCGKILKNKIQFYQHMMCHKDPKHQCDKCGKKFILKSNLTMHMQMHAGEKPFVCEKCGRRFARQDHLTTHLPTHDKIRPFACKQCDWSFGANYLLTRHIKQVHEGIKVPPPKKRKKLT